MTRNAQSGRVDVVSRCASPDRLRPILHVSRTGDNRAFLVASAPKGASPGAAASEAYAQIGEVLRADRLEIVQERIFGSLSVEAEVLAARREALQSRGVRPDGPMNYLQGQPTWGEGWAGTIIHAVVARSADGVQIILDGDIPCGRAWRSSDATFMILQNLRGMSGGPGDDNTPASQSRRMIERADRILRQNGACYRNTVRTWFHLSDILSWYAEFNRVRNAKYDEFGLMPRAGGNHLLPASTGIRAELPGGAACSLDLLAVVAEKTPEPIVNRLSNPCQQEAFRYGSAFSRSAVVRGERETLIEISGTAAIDEHGRSLYPGDMRAQTHSTLDKITALLEQTQASLQDIRAATVFVKHAEDTEIARGVIAERGIERLPAVFVVADVCRDELLFEIDAEAVVPRSRRNALPGQRSDLTPTDDTSSAL